MNPGLYALPVDCLVRGRKRGSSEQS